MNNFTSNILPFQQPIVILNHFQVSDLNAEQRCTELQNKLFELSSKLNQETIQKDELVSNSERSQNEVADLKKKLDAYLAEKSEATFKLQSLESDSTSLKLKLEDALRRLVIQKGIVCKLVIHDTGN